MFRAIILGVIIAALCTFDTAAAARRHATHYTSRPRIVIHPLKRSELEFYQKNLNFSDLTRLLPDITGVVSIYGIGVSFCVFGNLWLGAALTASVQHREMEPHEALEIIASCFLPLIGRNIARYYLKHHPDYDAFVRRTYPRYTYTHQLAIY